MPRMSNVEKQKSHARILQSAAELSREKGLENLSVTDVMAAAGMTHGGFYRHFTSKDELLTAAVRKAVDGAVACLESETESSARDSARAAYLDTYLSEEHVNNLRHSCPMAALGSELARTEGGAKAEIAVAVDRVAALLQGDGDLQAGYKQLALIVGTITIARLANDPAKTQSILSAGREGLDQMK